MNFHFKPSYKVARIKAYFNTLQAVAYNRTKRIPYPRSAHFVPTFRCNGRCIMCDIWKRTPPPELSTQEMKRVLSQLTCLDIIKVIGGEPTLRDDLIELVHYIRKSINPYILQIISNGFQPDHLEALAKETAWSGLMIRISLDGRGDRHDEIRGFTGAYNLVCDSLQRLVNIRKHQQFRIGINFNVTDRTLQDYSPLKAMADDLGVDFIPGIPVKPFLDAKGSLSVEKKTVFLSMQKEAMKSLIGKQMQNKKNYPFFERLFLSRTDDRIFEKLLFSEKSLRFRCMELRSLIYVLSNGDIITCGLDHEPVGNLVQEDLSSIWRSNRIKEFRKRVDECPGCLQSAVEILSRMYTGSTR